MSVLVLQAASETAGDLSPFIDTFLGLFYALGLLGGTLILTVGWLFLIAWTFHAHDLGPPLAGVVFLAPLFAFLYVTGFWRYVAVQELAGFLTALYVLGTAGYLIYLWQWGSSPDDVGPRCESP